MADKTPNPPVHATVAGVVFHNPGQHPLPASAGKAVTAGTKSAHGDVLAGKGSLVFDNPA